MPITVEKSQNLKLNEKSSAALASILIHLEKQEDLVKNVQVLSNFSIDQDISMLMGVDVVQGIVVVLDKQYQLSEADMSWFNPSIGHGRSVFSTNNPLTRDKLAEQTGFSSSCGEFSITTQDEFGCDQTERRLVVDCGADEQLFPLYKKWLSQKTTVGDLDKQWKKMKFGDIVSVPEFAKQQRFQIAKQMDANCELIQSDTVNNVLSDMTHVYFLNNAVKNKPTTLVKTSALGGFRLFKSLSDKQRFVPTNMGIANSFYSWDKMTPQNMQRIEMTCSWTGRNNFNTQVMRPPLLTDVRKFENEYQLIQNTNLRMNLAQFSNSDDIVDKMEPREIYNITPGTKHMVNGSDTISSPVNMDHVILKRLMNRLDEVQQKFESFHLFNEQAVQGGRLILPREIYNYLA